MLDALPNNQAGFQWKVFSIGRTNKIRVECNMNIKRVSTEVTTTARVELTTSGQTTKASTETTTEELTTEKITTTIQTTSASTTQEKIDKFHWFEYFRFNRFLFAI